MFHKLNLYVWIAGFILISNLALAHSPVWPGKQLAEVLPEATTFTQKQAVMTPAQVVWCEKNLGESIRNEDRNPKFYVGVDKANAVVGTVFFMDATGVNGDIEMGLAINPQGEVMRVVLYQQSEGSEVNSDSFLKQFTSKKAAQKFKVGVDVSTPKGYKKSAQVVATAVRRGLLIALASLQLGGV